MDSSTLAPIAITAFYQFSPRTKEELTSLQETLRTFGASHDMRGLVLLATEGINGTVCGSPHAIDAWKETIETHFPDMHWNDSTADSLVFPRWLVKIREEIIALGRPDTSPDSLHRHLTPEEWEQMLTEDVIVLDARNNYETKLGMFRGAVDPDLRHFQDFNDYAKSGALPKDKKILMYCTGGSRCEKALLAMEEQGYDHVYQLQGGILAYLQQFPHSKFAGECFVFDHRVSVTQTLEPSAHYKLCPHCGDPGDVAIDCLRCKTACVICTSCERECLRTCSKNCRHIIDRTAAKDDHCIL